MLRRAATLLPRDQLVGTSTSVRHYAVKAAAGSKKKAAQAVVASRGGSGRPDGGAGDSRVEAIKKVLYESTPSVDERLARVAEVIPSAAVHETITRAWQLHSRHQREAHQAELARKYDSMRAAIDLLEKESPELFKLATQGKLQNTKQTGGNERLHGLVPRELRAPMETSAQGVWDGEWRRPKVAEQ